MRPKFVVAITSIAVLVLAAMVWLNRPKVTRAKLPAGEMSHQAISSKPNSLHVEPPVFAPVGTNNPTPKQERAAIETKIDRLTQLSLEGNPASLPEIFSALTYPDKEVREAAIEATTQVGDSNAIPVLKAASELVDDPEEKMAFLDAMEFLSVPLVNFDEPPTPVSSEQIAAAEQRSLLRRAETARENHVPHSRSTAADSVPAASAVP
jgi:hypothetical protein